MVWMGLFSCPSDFPLFHFLFSSVTQGFPEKNLHLMLNERTPCLMLETPMVRYCTPVGLSGLSSCSCVASNVRWTSLWCATWTLYVDVRMTHESVTIILRPSIPAHKITANDVNRITGLMWNLCGHKWTKRPPNSLWWQNGKQETKESSKTG